MSFSDWVKAVAFGLVVLVLLGVGGVLTYRQFDEYAQSRQQISSKQEEYVKSSIGVCLNADGISASFQCFAEAIAASKEEKTSQKDLKAQQDMSIWAMGVLLFTALTFLIATFGLVLLWGTLIHTRRASNAADSMVDEARKTTDATHDILRADRAYLSFHEFTAEWDKGGEYGFPEGADPQGTFTPLGINISIVVKNFARTPARNVRVIGFPDLGPVETGAAMPPTKEQFLVASSEIPAATPLDGRFLAQEQTMATKSYAISLDEIQKTRDGTHRFYIGIGCRYFDVFEADQYAAFAVKLTFTEPISFMALEPQPARVYVRPSISMSGNINT